MHNQTESLLLVDTHGSKITRLRVASLCCSGEERIIRKILSDMKGISNFTVNILGKYVIVQHCPRECCSSSALLAEKLNEMRLGATFQEIGDETSTTDDEDEKESIWGIIYLSAMLAFCAAGATIQYTTELSTLDIYLYISCYLACVMLGMIPLLEGCYVALLIRGTLDIKCLVSIAAFGALFIQEFLDAALVVLLFTAAEKFEEWALAWARGMVDTKKDTISSKCMKQDGTTVLLTAVQVGDIVVFRVGELISIDGRVIEGSAIVDESALTGEAMPISKKEGSRVLSGTLVQDGYIEVEVNELPENSTLRKLQDTVTEVQAERGHMATIVDDVAVYWTPSVIAISLSVLIIAGVTSGLWRLWFYRSLALIVLACPCAIVVSAPFPCVVAIALTAKEGVLIKGSSAVERYLESKYLQELSITH